MGEFRVPTFFLLSGYFFFKKEANEFKLSNYKTKLKKRIHTLLIPYIIWCILALILYIIFYYIKYNSFPFTNITSLITCFFFHNGTIIFPFPINGPLWYIRDLIILVIFSPIIFFILNNLNSTKFTLLICFIILPYLQLPLSLLFIGFIWFSIGASISIKKRNIISSFTKYNIIYVTYPLLICLNVLSRDYIIHTIIMQTTIIAGVCFIIKLSYLIFNKFKITSCNYGALVMFIYCSHFIVDYIKPIYTHIFSNSHLILTHIFIGLTTLIICVFLYNILNKIFQNTLKIIIGNR